MIKDKVIFERKLGSKGNTLGINIPIQLQEYLDIEDGSTIQMFGELGKHGKFIAIWKKKEE